MTCALSRNDLWSAAAWLRWHARILRDSNVDSDGNWASGDGPYDTPRATANRLKAEYAIKLELSRRLLRAARQVPRCTHEWEPCVVRDLLSNEVVEDYERCIFCEAQR